MQRLESCNMNVRTDLLELTLELTDAEYLHFEYTGSSNINAALSQEPVPRQIRMATQERSRFGTVTLVISQDGWTTNGLGLRQLFTDFVLPDRRGHVKVNTRMSDGAFVQFTAGEYLICFELLMQGDTADPALVLEHEVTLECLAIMLETGVAKHKQVY